jgi:hypothetical protein
MRNYSLKGLAIVMTTVGAYTLPAALMAAAFFYMPCTLIGASGGLTGAVLTKLDNRRPRFNNSFRATAVILCAIAGYSYDSRDPNQKALEKNQIVSGQLVLERPCPNGHPSVRRFFPTPN